jgi:hypothetical protein
VSCHAVIVFVAFQGLWLPGQRDDPIERGACVFEFADLAVRVVSVTGLDGDRHIAGRLVDGSRSGHPDITEATRTIDGVWNYTSGGYAGNGGGDSPKINFDRPGVMFGNNGHPNRGEPDHVIDLSNDILGVILQYNPGGLASC